MSAVFLKLVNLSIAAGWLILAVIAARLLLKKAPKWIACVLWALVALRLVCPFSPESALSLIPSTETIPAEIEMMHEPAIQSGIEAVNQTVNPVIAQSFTPTPASSANPLQIVVPILEVIWIAGMAALLVYALVSYLRLRRRVRASVPVEENVFACDDIPSPFILGIVKPRIYVPSSMEGETLDYVLTHEAAHIRRRDHWWKPLGYLLLTVYWFQPLCWVAYLLLCRDIELACDERVIRALGREEKAAYSQALLDCSFPRRKIAACPVAFGEVGVKARVRSVLNYKKPAFWLILAAVLVCIAVAVCFLTGPVTGDCLTYVPMQSAVGQRADFKVDLGKEVHGATITAEVWSGGECTSTDCVTITDATKDLSLLFLEHREDGAVTGMDLQIGADDAQPYTAFFPLPQTVAGWAISAGYDQRRIPVRPGEEVILAALSCDFGAGVPAFDCKSLMEEPGRLRVADHMIVIRASFATKLPEAGGIPLAGHYQCEREGFGGPFTLTLNPDRTFRYYEGYLSSYIGTGTWYPDGDTVTLVDNNLEAERRTYFTVDGTSLVYDKARSDPFIYVDLPDGTKFISTATPLEWFDSFGGDPIDYENARETTLDEFPGVTFRASSGAVEAVTSEGTEQLYWGMPVLNVYFCDLNGDGKRELCSSACLGSGLIDERIIVFDYANMQSYDLSDRGNFDFKLTCREDGLCVEKWDYGKKQMEDGWLLCSLEDLTPGSPLAELGWETEAEVFSYALDTEYYKAEAPGVRREGFVNTEPVHLGSIQDVIAQAEKERGNEYDTVEVAYDPTEEVFRVAFYMQDSLGGDVEVYMDKTGVTLLTVAGE